MIRQISLGLYYLSHFYFMDIVSQIILLFNKFKIPNVKTARWKNSALPNMVRHLNEKQNEKLQLLRTLNIQ